MVIALCTSTAARGVALPAPLQLQAAGQLSRYLGVQVGSYRDANYTWELANKQLVVRLALAMQKTTTADQRSVIVAAVVVPKLLYIGRHQWPSVDTVQLFQRRIHNFVWHGRFTAAKLAGRAWLSVDVAALPRAMGGIALPNLMTELLAMAADTVAKWAVWSSPATLVVGDVLMGQRPTWPPPAFRVTPRLIPRRAPAIRLGHSMRQTGARICEVHGGADPLPTKPQMVNAMGCLEYFHTAFEAVWYGRSMVLKVADLEGSVSSLYISAEARQHGAFCSEWVPHMELAALRLLTPEGRIINPSTQYRALCAPGVLLKDLVHWTWTEGRNLQVTALTRTCTHGIRRQLAHLMRLLVLNIPQLLHPWRHDGRVRYKAVDPGHAPVTRLLTGDYRLTSPPENRRLAGQAGCVVSTHGDLEKAMQQVTGDARIAYVHPHPRLARMVCLWAGQRRWQSSRRHFKSRLGQRTRISGTQKLAKAHIRWASHSAEAARGLELLHWRKIRRVVGLTPWGEQLLLRVKHHALSVYDPVSAGVHCPHDSCIRAGSVNLRHVFWTCPATERFIESVEGCRIPSGEL